MLSAAKHLNNTTQNRFFATLRMTKQRLSFLFCAEIATFVANKPRTVKRLELLAPAKDLASAIDAIDCGADAVYIGGTRFGARWRTSRGLPNTPTRSARNYTLRSTRCFSTTNSTRRRLSRNRSSMRGRTH